MMTEPRDAATPAGAAGGILAGGWSALPWWWEAAPPEEPAGLDLPAKADVAVVGAGFTGLSAALTLARAGRSVVVLDRDAPGFGASSRNGGMVGSGHRVAFADLVRTYGEPTAIALLREGLLALEFTAGLIEREGIACHFRRSGRFRAAWRPRDYETIARDIEAQQRAVGLEADVVPRAEQEREVATARYHGGAVYHRHGGLHPALFHAGLLERARHAGALVAGHTEVQAVSREPGGLRLVTARGTIRARDVIVATNGYTGPLTPGLHDRVAAVPSFIIATETLGANRVASLIPSGRMIVESRAAHGYYRPSPDGLRILFGARAALHPISPERAAAQLRKWLVGLFPDLADVRLTHSWSGFVAFTRAFLPAIGVRDGIHHALGYNGSGVAMAPYLGWRVANKVLGSDEGRCALDQLPFRPWPLAPALRALMPAASLWHRLKDLRDGS
jgi:glycine/D-amino acid oxidase-like deaminating enzyme